MFNMKSSYLFWLFLVISIHRESVKSQAILSDSTGLEGEELTLICDLSRTEAVSPTNLYGVRSLRVSKLNPETSTFVPQVVYALPTGPAPILQNQMDPTYYKVDAEGLDPKNPNNYGGNQNIMKITVTFTSLRCVDRGTYKCNAEFTVQDGLLFSTKTSERTQIFTIDVLPSLITATSNPFQSLGYENNQIVTFRCRFWGPPGMEVRWFYKQCQGDSFFEPIIQRWPFENDIETTTTRQYSQDCATIDMDSELKSVQLNQIGINNDPGALLCWVQCQAGIVDNLLFKELLQWNMTIDYKVQPSLITATSIPFEPLGYENNQNVTFRCRFRGPPTMEVRWFYKQCQGDSFFEPTIQRWPFENDIETTTTPQDSQDCTTIEMDSELKNVQLNRIGINNDPGTLLCWVQCQAGIVDNLFFRELLQWNMTIDYKAVTPNKADKKIFTEAELVGGIIGAFVGTLMLVAVIALIVFFIRREKGKHKNRTEDTDYDIIRRQAPLPSSAIQETERRYKNQAFRDYKEPIEPDPNAYSEIQDD